MQNIADDLTRLDAHSHNGTDSPLLTPASITRYTTTIAGSGYTADGGGNFSKTITVPAAITEINNYMVSFYLTATGERLFITWERVSATTYKIHVNDSTLAITALYN